MSVRVRVARDDALLVEVDDLRAAAALDRSLAADPVPGVGQPVPGARTVLVPFDPRVVPAATLAAELRARAAVLPSGAEGAGHLVVVPTVYDGADLDDVAAHLGCSPAEVVRRHTDARWTVGFVGFAPGFGYLVSDDPGLVVPRRTTPRTRVPAGAVALAGEHSGVYPRESPGGWQLVGRTGVVTWDVRRDPPALWVPGDRVRFEAVRESVRGAGAAFGTSSPVRQLEVPNQTGSAERGGLEVVEPGLQTLVQDLGRPGHADLGVAASGAADPRSLRAANRAVGNPVGAAALETLGGLRLRAHGAVVVAVTGAPAPLSTVPDGGGPARPHHLGRAFALADGDELSIGTPPRGLRSYVAVRGGLDVPAVLGSRATDVLAGLGPDPLRAGTLLPAGPPPSAAVETGETGAPDPAALPAPGEVVTLPLVLGPRDDWFTAQSLRLLTQQEWEVTARSNRVGLRLAGDTPLDRRPALADAELPSEGCVTGALQVPPDGRPVLFLADHPLTGGYPVVAAVPAAALWLAGQVPPGARLRFRVT
ncbi:urea amidolyase family protein [Isoptericola sp. S6320L]|uniref:5-oxoprolinase subunit B/C family protein n=1 Tax=Isoptericola sp. S6320L TaxID=2926411 RepID=UPI001FF2AB6D|nr:urea amidolyase family protein [Isoptericola sp. S6320L]MCK0117750.1 urea amidolyase family protein [Isoptericola sp. S6320L]